MVWTDEQIKNHKEVVDVLEGIVQEVFLFISKEKIVTERSIQKFILRK